MDRLELAATARENFRVSRGRKEPVPPEFSDAAELLNEEVRELFGHSIEEWIENGWPHPPASRTNKLSGGEKQQLVEAFAEGITELSTRLYNTRGVNVIECEDDTRHQAYNELFVEFGVFVHELSTAKGVVPVKAIKKAFLANSSNVFSELAVSFDRLGPRTIRAAVKSHPFDPQKKLEKDIAQAAPPDEAPRPQSEEYVGTKLLEGLLDRQERLHFLLPEDVELLEIQIAEQREKWSSVVEDMSGAVSQTSETWHDNFGFEQGTREQKMIMQKLGELSQLRAGAIVVEPDLEADYVTLGKTVTFRNETTDKESTYVIGGYLSAGQEGKISYRAPVARALLGARKGESRSVHIGGRAQEITILDLA